MDKRTLWETVGIGIILWVVGYFLGIVLFFFVPTTQIGWYLLPIGTIITSYILSVHIKKNRFSYFIKLGFVWCGIAIVFDYLFLVKLFKPADGYYKLDVYLYYIITFVLPPLMGWFNKFVEEK